MSQRSNRVLTCCYVTESKKKPKNQNQPTTQNDPLSIVINKEGLKVLKAYFIACLKLTY